MYSETSSQATSRSLRFAIAIVACVALALLPLLISSYGIFQLTMLMSYAIALLGIVVLTGYCGQISLGQGAFYGFGAYVAAVLITKAHLSYLVALPVAGAASFVAGAVFGLPALRLKGMYLALATFALAVALPQLLKHPSVEFLTGGVLGITLTLPKPPTAPPVGAAHWLYLIGLAALTLSLYITFNLLGSRVGRVFIAIRDNPIAAVAMGVNLARYKVLAFAFSSMLTGVAGALSAITIQYVAPDSFTMFLSIILLVGATIGGLNSIWGVIFGAMFILYVPNFAELVSRSAPTMIYGMALILVVVFVPNGVASLVERWAKYLLPNLFGSANASQEALLFPANISKRTVAPDEMDR